MHFTKEQESIFNFVQNATGHGIIDAVAGAGKTTTIIESAQYIPKTTKTLFCAFNKAISVEIANKFHQKGMNHIVVETIHALGFHILKHYFKSDRQFQIKDHKYRQIIHNVDSDEELRDVFEKLVLLNNYSGIDTANDKEKFGIKRLLYNAKERLLNMVHKYRTTLMKDDIESFKQMVLHYNIFNAREARTSSFDKELPCYLKCLNYYIEKGNEMAENSMLIDFADMLYLPFKWDLKPNDRFDFVFVDECQDLSRSQLNIVRLYRSREGRVIAVGDPRQSIYGFNGADIESFDRIKRQFAPMEPLTLTTSFRCPQKVIALAQQIRPDITGNKTDPGILERISLYDVTEAAQPGDLIISRIKSPLLILVFAFIDKDVKVKIHDDEVEGFIEEIKKLFKQDQLQEKLTSSVFESIKTDVIHRWSWIIEKEADKLYTGPERGLHIQSEMDYLNRKLEFLHKKYESWKSRVKTITDILKEIKEYISCKQNPITLSTIHRAKGLENERVFILNYDMLPHYREGMKDWERTQEENLEYVAVTRALETLYLVNSDDIDELVDEEDLFDDYPLVD